MKKSTLRKIIKETLRRHYILKEDFSDVAWDEFKDDFYKLSTEILYYFKKQGKTIHPTLLPSIFEKAALKLSRGRLSKQDF